MKKHNKKKAAPIKEKIVYYDAEADGNFKEFLDKQEQGTTVWVMPNKYTEESTNSSNHGRRI